MDKFGSFLELVRHRQSVRAYSTEPAYSHEPFYETGSGAYCGGS